MINNLFQIKYAHLEIKFSFKFLIYSAFDSIKIKQ